jgi:ABC-type sugar transport system permease subunit/ABC-type glycerol-3-phosphate transport system substrate-binding protein
VNCRYLALIAIGIGLFVLLSRWGEVADWTEATVRQEHVRPKRVVYWTSSGSPEVDLKRAREFMEKNPDTLVSPNFRETGGLQDILFVSFLSGSPPDVLHVAVSDIREMVATGRLRPMDDLLAGQLEKEPNFFANRPDGEAIVHRFLANPNDRYIREMDRYPAEAARLLHAHGKFIGFRATTGISTLTYNKRLFREAAKVFPDAGLLDAQGEPVPPTTWSEFLRVARVITDYGRKLAEQRGEPNPACYGVVIQGQRPRDLLRGIMPLAACAGSMGFDFKQGRFEYDSPAILGAFALLLKLKQDGCLLPGSESRHYEDVRTELAAGNAAMLIDGWHAALIGAERVPWAAKDLGSAAIPVPDEAAEALLGLKLPEGNKLPRSLGGTTQCIASLSQHPEAAWNWILFFSDPEVVKSEARRGIYPTTFEAAKHLDDPDWFPYPYQKQVWDILTNRTETWPEPPTHGPVQPTHADIFRKHFYEAGAGKLADVVKATRDEAAAVSKAANRDLAERVRNGETYPELWTFPDWDVRDGARFFRQQRDLVKRGTITSQVEALKHSLPPRYRDEAADFKPQESPWQAAWVPGLLLLTVFGFGAFTAAKGGWAALGRQARASWHAYVFVLPALVALFAFVIYPSLYQFYLSVHSGTGLAPLRYVGLENFRRIFAFGAEGWDRTFWVKVLPNTLTYMVVVTAGQIAIAFLFASLLNLPLRANRVYRVFYFVPLVTSLAIVSVIYIGLFSGADSGLNQLLDALGLRNLPHWLGLVEEPADRLDWLGSSRTGLGCVIFVGMWHGLPYTIILLLAGLQSVSPDLYDAAKVDGAGAWQRFRHVTVPEIRPILIVILFNSLVEAARAFSAAYVMTEGGSDHSSELVSTYIFKWGFTKPEGMEPNLGYASALGIVYAALLGTLTFVNVWIIARRWRRRLAVQPVPGGPVNG